MYICVCEYLYMYVWMDGWMYVQTYLHIYIHKDKKPRVVQENKFLPKYVHNYGHNQLCP